MCMLTYFPPQVQPDADALRNGTEFNQDGHGYAIVVPGKRPRLIVRHGLNGDKLIERFVRERTRYPHGAALFHSRFGTSGSGGKFNCHPFHVGGDRQTIVAHNGVLPATMQPDDSDLRCDTRLAADEIFASHFGHLSSEASRTKLGATIGKNNKLVILTINPAYSSTAYLVNEDSGIWDGGIWYSNYDYIGTKPKARADGDCFACFSKGSVDQYAICEHCNSCAYCLDDYDNGCRCDFKFNSEPSWSWWTGSDSVSA